MPACKEVFLQEAEGTAEGVDCENIRQKDFRRAAAAARMNSRAAALKKCPRGCRRLVLVRDNHVVTRGCNDGILTVTYGGWFKCMPDR